MRQAGIKRAALALCGLVLSLGAAPSAQAAFNDPLFVLTPQPPNPPNFLTPPLPPSSGTFEGPCGLTVGADGGLYVSDYYHHSVNLFGNNIHPVSPAYPYGYVAQLPAEDPVDGPCALALDSSGRLFVNNFHRDVVRFGAAPSFGIGTVIDSAHPTGLAVDQASDTLYVDERTRIAAFDALGTEVGEIGAASLEDGYGLAVSGFPVSEGFLYVADAASDTVKIYDPATDTVNPVASIDGTGTPLGHFVSLRNATLAVDDTTGEVYVADNLQPEYTYHPETVVYVFDATGAYEGRLKFSVENALPPGLAVDNSATTSQGRVYLTTGNSESASVYAYPPGAASAVGVPLATSGVLAQGSGGSGSGAVSAPPDALESASVAGLGAGAPAGAASPPPAAAPARTATGAKRPLHRKRPHRKARHHRAKGTRR